MVAQQNGLIPRQVFILLPEGLETYGLGSGDGNRDRNYNSTKKLPSKLSVSQLQEKKDFFNMKDIGTAYSQDICRVSSNSAMEVNVAVDGLRNELTAFRLFHMTVGLQQNNQIWKLNF